jgi:serine/threonine-protein kinase HipA
MAKNKITSYKPVDRVEVHLWGKMIGVVAMDPRYGYCAFRYTPELQASKLEPAPLHMPSQQNRTHLFTDLPVATYHRLPAMLSDALPDDFGNALINRYMAERGISPGSITPLDRLAYMGERAMGALTFRPVRGPAGHKHTAIALGELVHEARSAVHGNFDGDDHAQASLRSIIDVGTSAGGARAKAVIAWNPQTQAIQSGQLQAPPGFAHWLLKFDGMGQDSELGVSEHYGRIEYAYHLMACHAGIQMSECRLLEENGRAHFMTRRFDRSADNVRHHTQTLCALAHLDYKKKGTNAYAQLFAVVQELGLPYADREEAFRRMVFNILARNCDDHTKNFSFRLRQDHAWELAPGYDITFAHNPHGQWTHQHLMSVNGKFKDFTRQDVLVEADRYVIGSARQVIAQVEAALQTWPDCAQQAGLPATQMRHIADQFLSLP